LPLRTVTLAWRDQSSSSPSIDSTPTISKNASGNSGKILITIRRSDQKLWPLRTVTLACRNQTSSSLSIDSTSTIRKRASGNFCKIYSRSNDRIKSNCLYKPLLFPGATRPPPHGVSIPRPLYGKGPTKTQVKL